LARENPTGFLNRVSSRRLSWAIDSSMRFARSLGTLLSGAGGKLGLWGNRKGGAHSSEGHGHAPSRLDQRFLVGAFLVVAITFFLANAFTQEAMGRIDADSDSIAFNSAPSIEHLAALRTEARHVEFLLGSILSLGGGEERAAIEQALGELNRSANAYLALPISPGERASWRQLNDAITAFNGAIQRVLGEYDAGAAAAAHADLARILAAADRLSDASARAIEFNAKNGQSLALSIKAVRRDAMRVGYALNALCLVFALLAGLLVRRYVRRYSALLEDHAALEESRARELEAFASRAAHDILNPVAATQMSLALAAKRELPDARAREHIERATRNLLHIRTIIDDLLHFARAGAKPDPGARADVRGVVDDVTGSLRPAAEREGIDLQVEGLFPCYAGCSPGVLTSVVSNLVHNAMKYMGPGTDRRVTVRALDRGAFVRLEVEDTGPGVPPESMSDIFLPYVRGPTQGRDGLGLGLATVKRLCEAHGGQVGVHSELGRGSLFWFELPRFPDLPGSPEARAG